MTGKWDNLSKRRYETAAEERMICGFGVVTAKAKLRYHFRGDHLDMNPDLVHLKTVNCLVYQGRMWTIHQSFHTTNDFIFFKSTSKWWNDERCYVSQHEFGWREVRVAAMVLVSHMCLFHQALPSHIRVVMSWYERFFVSHGFLLHTTVYAPGQSQTLGRLLSICGLDGAYYTCSPHGRLPARKPWRQLRGTVWQWRLLYHPCGKSVSNHWRLLVQIWINTQR